MKSIKELQQMLVEELNKVLKCFNSDKILDYYNHEMGDTSFILSGILEQILQESGWESDKWMDDSLLTKVKIIGKKVSIWGVMIWGRIDTDEQWVSPFYFEIKLNNNFTDFVEFTFLFEEDGVSEITYQDFNQNRNMLDKGFYSTENWNTSERNWKYVINLNNENLMMRNMH